MLPDPKVFSLTLARRVTARSPHRKIQIQFETGEGGDLEMSSVLTGKIDGIGLSHLSPLS